MFDAWGNVLVQNGAGNVLNGLSLLDRGYTGHEHLQSVGLIHMNGRLYDAKLHRFLQPDNYVQDPGNTQNYNRYGYVLNNPLKYIDPSGEQGDIPGSNGTNTGDGTGSYTSTDLNQLWDDLKMKEWFKRNFSARNFGRAWDATTKAIDDTGSFIGRNVKSFLKNIGSLFGGHKKSGSTPNIATNINMNNISATPATPSMYNNFNLGNNTMISQYNGHPIIPANTVGSPGNSSNTFSTIGLFGDVANYSDVGSFRLASNGLFSPKYYSSGWNGGSRAGIKTYNFSKLGGKISAGAGLVTTGMSYYDISNGDTSPVTWADATIGTAGVISSGAYYFNGIEIPFVGEVVAAYGALRLSWDYGYYMGSYYGPSTWYGTNDNKWFK